MISIKNLYKSFGTHPILRDVNLEIKTGEVVSIIGPSGSGKSTLIRSINYLDAPDSGEVIIDSQKLSNNNQKQIRKNIGMVFQSFNLFSNMSVLENIVFAPIKVLKTSRKDAVKEAKILLKKVGLQNFGDKNPQDLSGGQKQRVAIARALAMNPKIMLFDEPTSSLDPEMIKEVLEVIESFAHKGMTILIVTHELDFAKRISDKIVFLDDGKIIEVSNPSSFFKKPKTRRAQEFLSKVL
ncbi:MAG: amino acid ABC transporter ATP-binding protein [Rickettsiales bacterium]